MLRNNRTFKLLLLNAIFIFRPKTIAEESDVQLKSYTRKDPSSTNGNVAMETEKNSINVSKMVAGTPSPKSKHRKNIIAKSGSEQEPYDNMEVTGGKNRYKRISQLAESVFGEKIVQQGNDIAPTGKSPSNLSPGMRSRKESSIEGVSYHVPFRRRNLTKSLTKVFHDFSSIKFRHSKV